ncbi:DUF4097 family beta strand repeat-containing protein [Butyrivibrio sp. AD3002]|uniref:DUF4097 family beta strand repeat-containing protein n=1 Tax=Butyrivibrio sp. AD3002 TaxID=1280670 RepID=UPI0003B42690|nr:DUF4097 family beta strand repeat-containing protein [Butyrivibrio sp. AD3002]
MNNRIVFMVAGVMVAFGAIILGAGILLGASPIIAIGSNGASARANKELVKDTIKLSEFDELDVDTASINTYLVRGDSYKLEYCAYEDNIPKVDQKGKKLKINQPSHNGILLSFNLDRNGEQYYKITVPDNAGIIDTKLEASSGTIAVDSVDIKGKVDVSSGVVKLDNIKSEDLRVSASSGDINLDKVITDKLSLELTSGDMHLTDCETDELSADMTSGLMVFEKFKVNKADLQSTSGDMKLGIAGKKDDYDFNIDATSGTIKVGGTITERKFRTDNNKEKYIKADITSGLFDVSFED